MNRKTERALRGSIRKWQGIVDGTGVDKGTKNCPLCKMVYAWHFVGETLRDGSPIPKDGEWVEYDGELIMCNSGLHASRDPFDALRYAPGETLCMVECDGEIIEMSNKLVCSRRRILARMDATAMLRYFARMQALSVVHLWDAPDVVLDYLMGGDEEIRAAAGVAARTAAWDAAWAAGRAAGRDAAGAAAWTAARTEFSELVYECFDGPMKSYNVRRL